MSQNKKAVRIQDVAKAAGVSVSTVSRVLNGKDDVASGTSKRILAIIDELGYTSNLAARSMRSQKNNLIGLIMPDIEFPYAFEIMKGVNKAITETEYDLLVYTTGNVQKKAAAIHEQHYVSLLNNSITDGVIIVTPAAAEFNSNAPIVSIDPHSIKPNYPSVHATNYQGAVEVMQYLLSLGHRRIGFITGRPELESAQRRLMGYRDALQSAGIDIDETLITEGDFTTKRGKLCARQLLTLEKPPTAIFGSNDQTAIAALEVAEEMGLRVPEDLSIIGFDNIPEAKYLGLTTMDQFLKQMGYIATQMLIKLIDQESLESYTYKMQTQLVVRSSCQPLINSYGEKSQQ